MTATAGRLASLSTVDLAPRQRLPRTCPVCGATALAVRSGAERVVLECGRCEGAWLVELGYLVPLGAPPSDPGPGSSVTAHTTVAPT